MALATILLYLLLLLPAFSSLLLLMRSRKEKKLASKLPPGPARLPIIGNLHQLGNLPHRTLFQLSQEHGPLMYLQLGSIPTIVASSAATAKEFLKTHDLECCSRPLLTSWKKLTYGFSDIGFSPYGNLWRELRKTCIIEFLSTKKIHLFQSITEEEVERMINSISSLSTDPSSPVNLSEHLFSLSNDITCRIAIGKKFSSDEKDNKSRIHEILEETEALLAGFFFSDYIPNIGWIDAITGMKARLEKNFLDLDSLYEQVIDEHLEKMMKGAQDEGKDTLDALLRIKNDQGNLTKNQIKTILLDIFLGGSDTSSSAMEWAMTELIRNPLVMKKVQVEVRGLFGRKGKVEESDLHQLHYLKCVVKEVMRLHPPAPLLIYRETMQHCSIHGFNIPPKTRLIINAWAIGREEGSWERPEEFYPERFLGSSIEMKGHDFQLIPFGAGRRICPGIHVGLLVVELALANLLCSFDWELPKGMKREDIDMEETIGLAVHRRSALRLVAKKYNVM